MTEDTGIRSATYWQQGQAPTGPGDEVPAAIPWFDLISNSNAEELLPQLSKPCPGLTGEMLDDLLTPDDRPEGVTYAGGRIKLASTFAVDARRLEQKRERGKAMRSGALLFQPVELLASDEWLLTCWHPIRTFAGAEKVAEGAPGPSDVVARDVVEEWGRLREPGGGDLGILIMERLALTYRKTAWELVGWHQDWELSLYVEDDLHNPEELPHLWGMMAVLRDWLNPLNPPGLRKLPSQAWLPNNDHARVVAIDDRIDKTLDQLNRLANSMRSSFSVLHIQTAEEARARKEQTQHRVELIAAIFLVPTLVVGFYGANTWVPGQGRQWGFGVMLVALLIFTAGAVMTVRSWRRREEVELKRLTEERSAAREVLLQALE
jgi:hypothetical protein